MNDRWFKGSGFRGSRVQRFRGSLFKVAGCGLQVHHAWRKGHGTERNGQGAQSRTIWGRNFYISVFCLLTSVFWCLGAGFRLHCRVWPRASSQIEKEATINP